MIIRTRDIIIAYVQTGESWLTCPRKKLPLRPPHWSGHVFVGQELNNILIGSANGFK